MKIKISLITIFLFLVMFFINTNSIIATEQVPDVTFQCKYVDPNKPDDYITSTIYAVKNGKQIDEAVVYYRIHRVSTVVNWKFENNTGFSGKAYYEAEATKGKCPPHILVWMDFFLFQSKLSAVFFADESTAMISSSRTIEEIKKRPERSWTLGNLETNIEWEKPPIELGDDSCEGLFGEIKNENGKTIYVEGTLGALLQDIFNIFKILGPVLVIVLSSFDFFKAVLAQDQDQKKKVSSKFIKRLIMAFAIFFLPIILGIILDIVEIENGMCYIL